MDTKQKECFDLLVDEINWTNIKWQIYLQLFGTSKDNIDLLNEYAPLCFRIYQDTLYDDIVLSISRLTDKSMQNGNMNLSLYRMLDLTKYDKELYSELSETLEILNETCTDIRKIRHKRIGHNDYESNKSNYINLKNTSRKQLKNTLSEISDFMNIISTELLDENILFEVFGVNDGELLIEHFKNLKTHYENQI